MIVLGRVEGGRGNDLGDDRAIEAPRFVEHVTRRFGELLLLVIEVVDAGAVLAAAIDKLAAGVGRIDVHPEDLEQLLEADLGRVIADLHGLGVAGGAGRNLLVGRVIDMTVDVAGDYRMHAVEFFKGRLHAPEAAAGKDRLGRRGFFHSLHLSLRVTGRGNAHTARQEQAAQHAKQVFHRGPPSTCRRRTSATAS